LQQKPDGAARVVLINFRIRHEGDRLVMRRFTDAVTGEGWPRSRADDSNPTSHPELCPSRWLPTMTMDQAMTMIVSGGAVAPENLSIAPGAAARRNVKSGTPGGQRDFTGHAPHALPASTCGGVGVNSRGEKRFSRGGVAMIKAVGGVAPWPSRC
jgi:hypothetical protein